MLSISQAARIEAHKLHGDGVWIILLEMRLTDDIVLYLTRNNEQVTWNGIEWIAFPFELEEIREETTGEMPSVILKVSNITRVVQRYIEDVSGGVGAEITIRVVHSNHLDILTPEIEETFTCNKTKCDNMWVSFELGMGETTIKRFPPRRFLKNFCPFKFKGIQCGVSPENTATSCARTLTACRSFKNSHRFGGFISIPQGGLYA